METDRGGEICSCSDFRSNNNELVKFETLWKNALFKKNFLIWLQKILIFLHKVEILTNSWQTSNFTTKSWNFAKGKILQQNCNSNNCNELKQVQQLLVWLVNLEWSSKKIQLPQDIDADELEVVQLVLWLALLASQKVPD